MALTMLDKQPQSSDRSAWSPELQAEFDAWDRASAEALELVERLAREGPDDATR